ncbi:DNA-processing protein DprA [Brevibacillus choshinensis]|uniref:DNA-processing protein DprA n=1 Tax=Brevibacillus choshinensis TaxID=54911 RepID=UPI002E1D1D3F|nr:DNA-processing protein DprA [Brevibacillus choshinensis]MED4582042.1 DNA-processing protein DprA [Brevibacillus choshinensis]
MVMIDREERDWLYLLSIVPGLGRKRIRSIYEIYGSFAEVVSDWPTIEKQWRIPPKVSEQVREHIKEEKGRILVEQRNRSEVNYLCFLDETFPDQLRHIPDAPLTLYSKGDLTLLHQPAIGVVGSRRPTPYGRACCAHLVKNLSNQGLVIISGLAQGIDGEAHRSALQAEGKTVGVLGCGIDQIYPTGHRALYRKIESLGLLVSEYPPGTLPLPGLFPERNRIISGLSLGILVVEGAEKSGSLVTADCALEQGRDVFAVPGSIFSSVSTGPHNLIKQGAKLVTSSMDVLEEWSHLFPSFTGNHLGSEVVKHLNEQEKAVLTALSYEGIHVDELTVQLSPDMQIVLHRSLLHLEAKGMIVSLPGGYFARR